LEVGSGTTGELDFPRGQVHGIVFGWQELGLQVGLVEEGGHGEDSLLFVVLLERFLALGQVLVCDHHVEIQGILDDEP